MLSLSFDPEVLEVQRKVVIEEFKQNYLNQPYGDVWLKLRPLVYEVHPYQWATIGKDVSHIADATLDQVKDFFYRYYVPSNAILVVAGKVTVPQVRALTEKWFGPIPAGNPPRRALPTEPVQQKPKFAEYTADVPADAFYQAFHMPGRFDDDFYAIDLMSDALGRGPSSRLYQQLVRKQELFTSISTHTTGSIDPGMLVISGRIKPGVTLEEAHDAVQSIVSDVATRGLEEEELERVKAQAESSLEFAEVEVLNRAINLAFATLSGNTAYVNEEAERIARVNADDIRRVASHVLRDTNATVMYYRSSRAQSEALKDAS
jgi:zinc protease